MAKIYVTRQGETVDAACQSFYGRTGGATEAVLAANPGLAGKGPVLPLGTRITMPELAAEEKTVTLVSLYD